MNLHPEFPLSWSAANRLQENALRNLGNVALKKKSCLRLTQEDEFFSFRGVH